MNDHETIKIVELLSQTGLREILRQWSDFLEAEYAEPTLLAYRKAVRLFRRYLNERSKDLHKVKSEDVRSWRDSLSESYAVQTVNLWMSGVRRFYVSLIDKGAPLQNPASAVRGISRRGKSRLHKRDELTASEVLGVIDTCDDTDVGRRDRAIISLMAYCALRTVELQRADIADLGTRDARSVLWVRGKGHAESDDYVVLPVAAEEAILDWLTVRGSNKGPLFWSLSNQNRGDRLTLRAIRWIVKEHFKLAGVVNRGKTTHSLRHSAISNAIRNGATPLQVQAMARHRSFDTTLGYYHEIARTENPAEDLINYSTRQ
jgi:site-specific recombinase XerD